MIKPRNKILCPCMHIEHKLGYITISNNNGDNIPWMTSPTVHFFFFNESTYFMANPSEIASTLIEFTDPLTGEWWNYDGWI